MRLGERATRSTRPANDVGLRAQAQRFELSASSHREDAPELTERRSEQRQVGPQPVWRDRLLGGWASVAV